MGTAKGTAAAANDRAASVYAEDDETRAAIVLY